MEKELNIAAILKEKPKGTKLWSPIVGSCTFKGISSKNSAIVASFFDKDREQLDWDFNEYGKTLSAPKEAEVCLFPSKEMRDWSKFAWKKGDVLVCKSDSPHTYTIFDHFTNNEYTEFYGKFHYSHKYHEDYGNTNGKTAIYEKIPEERVEFFIKVLEDVMGGQAQPQYIGDREAARVQGWGYN